MIHRRRFLPLVRDEDGSVTAIVEDRDADDDQRAITEINTSVYVFDGDLLPAALAGNQWRVIALPPAPELDAGDRQTGARLGDPAFDRRAELNKPSASLEGLGYGVKLESGACATIEVVEGPDDFMAPTPELRGELNVCSGCLGDLSAP